MGRRLAAALVAAALSPLAGACRESTVTLDRSPAVGDRYSYRYELTATVSQSLEGAEPTRTDITTTIQADQEVLEVHAGGVRAEVTIRRDGGAPRRAVVRLDRAGALQGLELVEGQRPELLGLDDLGAVLSTVPLPAGPLSPGARWTIDDGGVSGAGRLVRLGVIDGRDAAVVRTDTTQPVDEISPAGDTTAALEGRLRSRTTTAYDLDDGSVRRASSRTEGEVRARIDPPPGVDAEPVLGTITYAVRVRVTRLD
jgi:hypothetical protein